jgi:hypothetical protein
MSGAYKFKDSSGNIIGYISGSDAGVIKISGSALDLSGVGTLTLGSTALTGGGLATTGSNTFVGTQTLSGSIIPAVNNTYDLGDPTHQFRHVYISSGSLYINGTKVLGSTSQELQITTDVGQSFKVLESGSDTITLQSADGNVTLTSSGQGDIVLDPYTGIIGLKGTVTVYTGNKIVSSDGNSVQFGNGIAVTGSIVSTVTPLVSGSSQISYTGITNVPSGIISGSSQITSQGYATTGSNNFQGTQTITGSLYVSQNLVVQGSSSLQDVTGSNVYIGTNKINLNTNTPAIRFGGISVFDSGSNFGESGSLLWDSQNNRWVYQHPASSGAPYKSAIIIAGPQNSGSLGNETTLTSGKITKAVGDDHIGDSIMTETGGGIGISGSLSITGSIVATGTSLWSGSGQLPSGTVSGSAQIDVLSTTNIARLATTGSNTFVGNQVVSGSFKVSGSLESSYDNLGTEGGQLILRGNVNRYNVDNWSGNALRIFREDDATAGNGNVIIFASGSGQVGINKNSTSATLDVNGNALVTGSITNRGVVIDGANNSNTATLNFTRTDNSWGINNETNLRIYVGSGNTTSPGTKTLEITTGGQTQFPINTNGGNIRLTSNGTAIEMYNTSGTVRNWQISSQVVNSMCMDFTPSTVNGGTTYSTPVLTIDGEQNRVGIGTGTSRPTANGLTIYQGGSDRRIMLELNRPNNPGLQSAIQFTVGNSILVGQIQHEYSSSNYNHMSFTLRNPGGSNIVPLWLQNDGSIGMGTTTPSYNLDIQGAEAKLQLKNTSTGGGTYVLASTYNSWSAGGGKFVITSDGGSAGIKFAIDSSGNIGMGTYSPVTKLDVSGNIKYAGRVFSNNAIVGNISTNLASANGTNYILVCNLNDAAGWSLVGHCNAASYTCWNISQIWIQKNYSSTACSAGITGLYKGGGCNMSIVDLSYGGGRYIAIGYTSNPEIDVVWSGYNLLQSFGSDGYATVVSAGSVTVNSTLATY